MGTGNYLPEIRPYEDYRMIYVDVADINGDWNQLIEEIESLLPNSFRSCTDGWKPGGEVIAYNKLLKIVLIDWGVYFVVMIRMNLDAPTNCYGLAYAHMYKLAPKLFDELYELGFKLSIRKDAWITTPYFKKGES